jgi:hypothetical protein
MQISDQKELERKNRLLFVLWIATISATCTSIVGGIIGGAICRYVTKEPVTMGAIVGNFSITAVAICAQIAVTRAFLRLDREQDIPKNEPN